MPNINISNYTYIHCKLPRGKNSYIFQPGDGAGHIYNDVKPYTTEYMTYTNAVKFIKKHWKGYMEIYLLDSVYKD